MRPRWLTDESDAQKHRDEAHRGTPCESPAPCGVPTVLHGSGFLAVLLAGIMVGGARAPFKREIKRFTSGLAAIGEIAAFMILGLSVSLDVVFEPGVIWPGLAIAAILIFAVRPIVVGLILIPAR